MRRMLNSRKAQVGETMTWVVATVIIIVLLIVFIWISYSLAKSRGVIDFAQNVIDLDGEVEVNWVHAKTDFAFGVDSTNRGKINDWIEDEQTS